MAPLKGTLTPAHTVRGVMSVGGGGTTNYEDLENLPQINGVELKGNKTTEELGINIPTKTSDLDNDSGFVTSADIPTKTSELDNDSGFITGDNYYDKSEIDTALSGKADKSDTYTKSQVDTALSGKADKSDTYTKTETDNKIVGLIDDSSTANNKAWSASKIGGELSGKASTGDLALKADKSDTYTKTQTDSAIVGLIDDTTTANNKAWSSSKITDEIINILPTGTASGSVASFKTSLALPLVSAKFDINASQESGTPTPSTPKAITGVSAVNLTRCGANLCNQADIVSAYPTKYTVDTDGSIKTVGNLGLSDVLWTNKSKVSGVLNVIFVSKYQNTGSVGIRPKIIYTDGTNSVIYTTNTQDYSTRTLLTTSGKTVEKIVVDYGTNNPTNFFIEVTLDTSASTYEAYNGNTVAINLGDTIYGGYIKQDSNGVKLVVTHKRYDLGSMSWQVHNQGYYYSTKPDDMFKYLSTEMPDWKAEKYSVQTGQWIYGHGTTVGYIGANGGLIYATDSTTPSGYLVAPITEPIEIDLTDIPQFTTFIGTNNIFADSGNSEVVYKKSINDAIAELQALFLS